MSAVLLIGAVIALAVAAPATRRGVYAAAVLRMVVRLLGWLVWCARWTRIPAAQGVRRARLVDAQRIRRRWRRDAAALGLIHTHQREIQVRRRGEQMLDIRTVKQWPRIRVLPEPWGVRVRMRTVPGVGLAECERHAEHLADCWRAEHVEVERLPRGRVELRSVVGDAIGEHRPFDWNATDEWQLPVGHDPWGEPVTIPLRQLSGVKVGGLPGFGKSQLLLGWCAVLGARPEVQLAVFDGKVRDPELGDWSVFADRAMFMVGDDPDEANEHLIRLVELVKVRPYLLREERGTHRFWRDGPTVDNPLVLVVVDEAHNFVDSSGLSRDGRAVVEANKRMMRTLVKEGRGLGVLPIPSTQKATADALPTAARDNLEVGLCFATSVIEAAEAVLGAGIRADEPNWPTNLRDKHKYVGVCVVTGVPGLDGKYQRVRVGDIEDDVLEQVVAVHADHRRELGEVMGLPKPVKAGEVIALPGLEEVA